MAKKISIINYGAGNLHSVEKAFNNVAGANYKVEVTSTPVESDYLVLPGVGAFAACANGLKQNNHAQDYLLKHIQQGKPFLGICVGMQLLADYGLEDGKHEGLGLISGEVQKFDLPQEYSIPHMGWNNVSFPKESRLHSLNQQDFYFVHSYHFAAKQQGCVTGQANYGKNFIASIEKDNILAVQFHPEKSQGNGLKVLKTFIEA